MTNADVIRKMTDDELYKFLGAFEVGDIDYALTFCNWCGEDIDCDTCFRRWLFGDANDYNGLLADKGINSGYADCKTENSSEKPNNSTISKMEQVDESQTELVRVKYHCINCAENGSYKCSKCDGEMYYKYDKDEPQTYITEDRDTQILDAWQVHHRSTTSVEGEPQSLE